MGMELQQNGGDQDQDAVHKVERREMGGAPNQAILTDGNPNKTSSRLFIRCSGNRVDFHLKPSPQHCLDSGSGGGNASDELRVGLVKRVEILDVRQVARTLHNIVESAARFLQDLKYGRQRPRCFLTGGAAYHVACLKILRRVTAHKEPSIAEQSGRVISRVGFLIRMFYRCAAHSWTQPLYAVGIVLGANRRVHFPPLVPSHPTEQMSTHAVKCG